MPPPPGRASHCYHMGHGRTWQPLLPQEPRAQVEVVIASGPSIVRLASSEYEPLLDTYVHMLQSTFRMLFWHLWLIQGAGRGGLCLSGESTETSNA